MEIKGILIGALAGGIVTIITAFILKKRARYVIERSDEEFKQGLNLPIGANLRVLHGDREIENFRITSFIITNDSITDFENVKIRIWSGPDRFVLHDTISKLNFMDVIPYHPEFVSSLQPDVNNEYTPLQISKYNTQREYLIPTFNRFEAVKIVVVSFVETNTQSNVWIEIPHKGIKADIKYFRSFLLGAPTDETLPFTLVFIIIAIILPAYFLQNPWLIALVAGLGAGFSALFAAVVYRIRKWLLKIFAD